MVCEATAIQKIQTEEGRKDEEVMENLCIEEREEMKEEAVNRRASVT